MDADWKRRYPAGEGRECPYVSPPITWAAADIPGAGHYCFVATLDHPQDPGTNPTDLASLTAAWSLDWNNFLRLIRRNNNITWRNFNIIDTAAQLATDVGADYRPLGACLVLPFVAVGAPDHTRHAHLRIVDQLPEWCRLFLEVPISLQEWAVATLLRARPRGPPPEWHQLDQSRGLVALNPGGSNSWWPAALGQVAPPDETDRAGRGKTANPRSDSGRPVVR